MNTKSLQSKRKEILEKQLIRLATIFFSKPTITSNSIFHTRVGILQAKCINQLYSL